MLQEHRARAVNKQDERDFIGGHPEIMLTGEPVTTAVDLRSADQEVFHDPEHASTLTLPCAMRSAT